MNQAPPIPRIIARRGPDGPRGFLAVTPNGESPRIGVEGDTEEDARSRFRTAWAEWWELNQRPDLKTPRKGGRLL